MNSQWAPTVRFFISLFTSSQRCFTGKLHLELEIVYKIHSCGIFRIRLVLFKDLNRVLSSDSFTNFSMNDYRKQSRSDWTTPKHMVDHLKTSIEIDIDWFCNTFVHQVSMSPYFINSFQNPLDKAIRLNETLIGEQWPNSWIVCHNSEWKMNRWNIDRGVSDCKSLISSSWPTDKSKQWQRNCKSHRMFLVCVPSTSLTVITNASTEEKIWWTRRFIEMHRLNGINIVTSSAGNSLARFMECLSSALVDCIGIFLFALIIIPLEIQRERENWHDILEWDWCTLVLDCG